MALVEYDLFGQKRDKVQTAINRLKTFEPEEGYYVADSGGKDSTCVVKLFKYSLCICVYYMVYGLCAALGMRM